VEDGGSFYIRSSYRRWGIVNWYQRYRGTVKQELALHKFPFDTQEVKIRFGMSLYGAEDILLLDRTDPKVVAGFDRRVEDLHEWALEMPSCVREVSVFNEEDQRDISFLEVSFRVRRMGGYYFSNVFLLVYFLNALMWWTFFIDPNTLNDRLQICITCFLALVAFNFVVAETLPRINHSTHITHFFLLNYATIALCAIESGVVFMLDKHIAAPNGYNTAKIIDWTLMGVYAVLQTALTVLCFLIARGAVRLKQELPEHTHAAPAAEDIDAAGGETKKEAEELVEVNVKQTIVDL
jgi:hypothetical protein